MAVREQLEEVLEELPTTEEELKEQVAVAVVEAARRLEKDTPAKIALIGVFVVSSAAQMIFNWFTGQGIVTPELLVPVLGVGVLYMVFRFGLVKFNTANLKLQREAIELDIMELDVSKKNKENELVELDKKAVMAREDAAFEREQDRIDRKLKNDLEIRTPFFQEAQTKAFELFTRDNASEHLDVPASLVDKINELDKILMRQERFDTMGDEIKLRLKTITDNFEKLHYDSQQTGKLMDSFMEMTSTLTVRHDQLETSVKVMRENMTALNKRVSDMMVVIDSKLGQIESMLVTGDGQEEEEEEPVSLPLPPSGDDGGL